uniref:Uncharacterized protein n=1 Tax=Anguilla anguilla TaxID=7936 RepID=A0A0E9SW30_ANGAN
MAHACAHLVIRINILTYIPSRHWGRGVG